VHLMCLCLEVPVDAVYGELRARLERAGRSIGANALLIAPHALTLGHTVVTRANSRGSMTFASKIGRDDSDGADRLAG
jgi:predicted nucleic acid-binding protein